MTKTLDNEEKIMIFLESVKNQIITSEESLQFKKDLTEVIFKPRDKKKKNIFCKQMDMEVFEAILEDLEVPYRIRRIEEASLSYIVENRKTLDK